MKVYQFRIVGFSLILSILSFVITFIPFLSIVFATISFVATCIWWCSNYPGILLKDVSEKIGKCVGLVIILSSMLGTMFIAIFAVIEATKPLLFGSIDREIWPRYDWYFFVMYIFPATLIIYFLVRGSLFLRRGK